MRRNRNVEIISLARELRKGQTDTENEFWELVRNRRFKGVKFLRQHPIELEYLGQKKHFVADFYCAKAKLIIELDGSIHENQKEHDELRTYLISNLGVRVVRINNEELKDRESLMEKLNKTC